MFNFIDAWISPKDRNQIYIITEFLSGYDLKKVLKSAKNQTVEVTR